ncbi:MAG: hypothetical protein P8X74_22065 [Reinekea sp.]
MNVLKEVYESLGNEKAEIDSQFWSYVIPIVLKLQSEGASFLIKSDGERSSNVFTVMIEGGRLGDEYLRCETDDLQEGVSQLILDYSLKFWD